MGLPSLIAERRLAVLAKFLFVKPSSTPIGFKYITTSASRLEEAEGKTVSIGDVTKPLKNPSFSELVPTEYLPKDDQIPKETLKHLKWMMQKDLLGQDVFLIGRPGPLRRQLTMQYLELTNRELEYVALSRDTTESDLKQRREIINGTAHYIDQSAVRAASQGRILVLEGIEKAERNVLPVLNNLLENREMHLEDGRLLIPAVRYDKLLADHGQEELDKWQLVRVSEDFRVIALGLPVPNYSGNPLDPPLRSRFQARDVRHVPFAEQLKVLQALGPNLPSEMVSQLLSFAHTMVTEESHNLGLCDFPLENLPAIVSMLNNAPNTPLNDAVNRLYPYHSFLTKDGSTSVEDTLQTFELEHRGSVLSKILKPYNDQGFVQIQIGKRKHQVPVPMGHQNLQTAAKNYVEIPYHESFLAELALSHSVHDFCIIGPRGCGKSVIVEKLAGLLGYEMEPIMLYQDMTARDLLQQRTTLPSGDTVWRYSPLVQAALEGKMAVLDGVHRMHKGTLAVLHRLIHDRELQLYDGTRLLGGDRYEEAKERCGCKTDEEMAERKILRIKDNFRIVALAEPPTVGGSAKGQWLTTEMLSMFLFHEMRSLSKLEERNVLESLVGNEISPTLDAILGVTYALRNSGDSSLSNIANSLTTRQLVRIARRQKLFPNEDVYELIHKAVLARFLPSLPKESLDTIMADLNIQKLGDQVQKSMSCKISDNTLTIGGTSVGLYDPMNKTKIPETLFYNTDQNLATLEAMLQDYSLGEHLLLIGNQGVGKNKLVDQMLNLLNRPREYIQLHRDTSVQSLTLQPTVDCGVIVYEDSPLVKAVKNGYILVVDEADKAPTHVTCILKTLVEAGEMILSDGRRIVPPNSPNQGDKFIRMHPDFRLMVLANRPGFPFLGNDFFAALGDLFSCHAIDNPSQESEMSMLKQYGPDVPEETLRRLVKAFSELRNKADEGTIQYPYSTREVVNIVKHLQKFPNEGLGQVVRNVFDFDAYDTEARKSVEEVLHKHGIPINATKRDISLAREISLPDRRLLGSWEIVRNQGRGKQMMMLPTEEYLLDFDGPQNINIHYEPLDRVEARGLGFSEMQSYWALPFHDFAVVGDVCTIPDKHNRQLYDSIHVTTVNPVWMYSMKPLSDKMSRISLNHIFDKSSQGGGTFASVIAVHDEVSNNLVLVEPKSGSVISVHMNPSEWLAPVKDVARKMGMSSSTSAKTNYYRMVTDFAPENKLLFYTPQDNVIQLLDLSAEAPKRHRLELPFKISSLHPLNENQYLVSAVDEGQKEPNLFLLRKESSEEALPSHLNPVAQNLDAGALGDIIRSGKGGLSDMGLRLVLGETVSSPNTLLSTKNTYATLVMGFPELEFSANEVLAWPKLDDPKAIHENYQQQFVDEGKHKVFLKESCQIVSPIPPNQIPSEAKDNNYGLSSPGNIMAYLQVVDLMAGKLRFIPVPEASSQSSIYASWYKQTYPGQVLALAPMSNEGLVSVDNGGTVRIWETGVASLSRSLSEWRRMIGDMDNRDLMIMRDKVGDLDSPKHGKIDPQNAPHIGGNTWAGGTGGRDTAGLGGVGGPYRLDAGHDVHQVSDEVKAQVPEHIRQAAREMNRKAFAERLREIKMSEFDAQLYDQYASQVRKQTRSLKSIINGLQAKAKDRQWLKHQTEGELDDTRLIEGITGEKTIYKRRGEQEPEPGAPQEKPKRLRLVVDVSGSMYRFNGHDQRLDRMMESALMVMEALEGYSERIVYDIVGHSGEENDLPFTQVNHPPANEKERLDVLKTMHAHAQFCMSGDHTLSATVLAIQELAHTGENYDESFVIVLSDANFDRYGISPKNFAKALKGRNEEVNAFAIFIGSLGDQAERLTKNLPTGKAFVCLDTKRIPEVLKTIFTSTMLK